MTGQTQPAIPPGTDIDGVGVVPARKHGRLRNRDWPGALSSVTADAADILQEVIDMSGRREELEQKGLTGGYYLILDKDGHVYAALTVGPHAGRMVNAPEPLEGLNYRHTATRLPPDLTRVFSCLMAIISSDMAYETAERLLEPYMSREDFHKYIPIVSLRAPIS